MKSTWTEERELWLRALIKEGNSRRRIAVKMGVSINTIGEKAKRLGIYKDIEKGFVPSGINERFSHSGVTLPGKDWTLKEKEG